VQFPSDHELSRRHLATNQITTSGYSYDASGNMLNDGNNTLTYDAENRALTSAGSLGSATFTYDGNGLRVEKSGSNGSTIYIFSGAKVIAEYAPGAQPSSPATEYIYSGAKLVASIAGGAATYYHPDQLSVRALTNSTGSVVGQQGTYPFGESWYAVNTTTKWFFTSYERDPESANDYAMARYYVNRLGRFNSPDPLGGPIGDPQSWNRYVYVRNNPLSWIDPLGLSCMDFQVLQEDGTTITEQYDDGDGLGCDAAGAGAGDPDDPFSGIVPQVFNFNYDPETFIPSVDSDPGTDDPSQQGFGPNNPPWLPQNRYNFRPPLKNTPPNVDPGPPNPTDPPPPFKGVPPDQIIPGAEPPIDIPPDATALDRAILALTQLAKALGGFMPNPSPVICLTCDPCQRNPNGCT
jgi:RHS repeat-associated protein